MAISFSTEDISYKLPEKENIQDWISEVAHNKGFKVGEINYNFCSDAYILKINKQFLSHDYTTDIITFDYSTRGKISGDILISIPTVNVNSEKFQVPFFNELLRVIIHGVLHLIGYHDSTEEEKNVMRKEEDLSLLLYQTNFQ